MKEITVQLLEDGRVYLSKRLDDDPMGYALGQTFVPESVMELGEAVKSMLESE
jgi:hypothetical protein